MRIVSGSFAGRDLVSPADQRVRPTAEPVRDALLGALAAELAGAKVLDLFAGTGALGLEAISRGAASADFVEYRPASLHALKANIAALRLGRQTRIFKRDAMEFVATLAEGAYGIAFADPPYTAKVHERLIALWRERRFSAVLTIEHARSTELPKAHWRRSFDETTVSVYRL